MPPIHVTPSWRFGRGRPELPGPIAGAMAAAELDLDVAAITTRNVYFASLAAAESGEDVAALAGDIHVRGSLTTFELGADTADIIGPVVGSLSASLTLTSSSTGTKPFCVGHAFVQGDVPQGGNVAVTGASASAQVTHKNYWPDGSLKFAIIAGTYSQSSAGAATVLSLSAGSSSGSALTTEELKATAITASFNAGAFGSASWSGTDWDTPFQTWISGHEMSSWVYRKQIGSDAHLVAWMEVRLWSTGAVEVLPWVENGYLNVASPTNKSATYTFTLGGSQRFSQAIDLPNHCRTPLVSGTALSHWLGTDPAVTPLHDTDYLQQTEMVPSYRVTVSSSATSVTSLPTTFTPLQQGSYADSMGEGGYHRSIGLIPEWDVLYLTCTTSSRPYEGLVRNAYSAGRYGIHYRDESTNRPLRFSSYPNLVIGTGNHNISDAGSSSINTYTPAPSGTSPAKWAVTHHPAVGFMAYLVTGRYYFMEEVQFAATVNFLKNSDTTRQTTAGIFRSDAGANTVRGMAWNNRTLFQAACVTPDSDTPLRTEFLNSVYSNVNYLHARYVAQTNNAFGCVTPYANYVNDASNPQVGESTYHLSTWQQDFVTAAFGYGLSLDLPITDPTKLTAFFSWKAQSVIGRFGGITATEWLYRDAANYTIEISSSSSPDFSGGTGPWYASWGAMYTATIGTANPGVNGDLRGGNYADATSYWGNLQPALAYAVQHGVSGAQEAYARMTGAPNWDDFETSAATAPVWAVKPLEEFPAWREGLAVNEWTEITGSAMSNTPPTVNPGGTAAMKIDAWGGLSIDTRTNTLWGLALGGHNDYYGNEPMRQRLMVDSPTWTEMLASSASGAVTASSARYSDGKPASAHAYWTQQFIEARNRAMRFSASGASTNGNSFTSVEAYDSTVAAGVNGWDAAGTITAVPGLTYTANVSCKDPTTEDVYFFRANTHVYKWTQATGVWTTATTTLPADFTESAPAFDSARGRIFLFHGANSPTACHTFDTATNTFTARTLTGTGAAAVNAADKGMGMVYVPALDAYLMRLETASGGTLYSINASTFDVTAMTTTGGGSIVAPANPPNGVYGRLLYAPSLRGVLLVPRYSSNTWFMRTH